MNATNVGAVPRSSGLSREALDFAPGLLSIQEDPPARMPRAVLLAVTSLIALMGGWAALGHLDIVASADGRLVPKTYVKVVQPADAGIVQQILVQEGQHVTAGQVLLRMNGQDAQADETQLRTELAERSLQLRRINAELTGVALSRRADDPPELYRQVQSQLQARRQTYQDSLAQAQGQLRKAEQDYGSGQAVLTKLSETTPILKSQSEAYASLGHDGYVPRVTVNDKQRAYLESAQDLAAQQASVQGLSAAVDEAQQQVQQISAKYRSDLADERVEAEDAYQKLEQDWVKQAHRSSLLELKAPQSGTVKDLATHTIGTVVSAGTVLLSIVPDQVPLVAEVMIRNEDVGFVHAGLPVKIKLAAYPFQKYGLLDGKVLQVWPDASDQESSGQQTTSSSRDAAAAASDSGAFKALVALDRQTLTAAGESLDLVPGMAIVAEVREGRRTVLQYLLSPVERTLHDSARER